ncbi:hypothetical protein Tco_0205790 [Tanacetum coccineum]
MAERVTALEKKLSELEQNNKNLDNTTRNLGSRVFTLELRDLPHKIDETVCENVKEAVQIALQAPLIDCFRDLPEADLKEMFHQRMFEIDPPPPLLDYDLSKKKQHDSGASGSSQPPALQSFSWKTSNTRDVPSSSSKQQSSPHSEQPVEDIPMPNTESISDLEDTGYAHLLYIKLMPEWLKLILEDDKPATPEPSWVIPNPSFLDAKKQLGHCVYLEGQDYEVIKAFYPDVVHLHIQMEECHKMLTNQIDWANPEGDQVRIDISRPLSLSASPLFVTIQTQFFFNKDLDYLRYGSKGCKQALSISKMKAARYHDFRLELLVPEHIADHQEYTIVEKDFQKLVPSDFEDLNVLLLQVIRQRVEDFQLGIESYQKQLNLTKPKWDVKGFEYKHDYTIIDSPRAVVFLVSNNERKIMRVKEYKVNRHNPGMNTRFWKVKDVERSKEFIHAIEQRLKTRRIFQNLECFIGGRMTKVIKGEFGKIKDVKVEDVSLTCDTPLEVFNKEVSRLSGMDNDLFTYEVEVANIPCNSKMDDDSEHEADDDLGYDPSNIYRIGGDDEVELTDEESLMMKIKLLKSFGSTLIYLTTRHLSTYEDYKDDWIYEWNKDVPWVYDKPWLDNGIWKEPTNIRANLSIIRLDVRNGQHVVGWMMDIVMEETYPELTLLETNYITKTLNGMRLWKIVNLKMRL